MIECFTVETEKYFGDIRYKLFQFRHKIFIRQEGYRVFDYNGMEFDRYDTPATTYFVYRDQASDILGTIRIVPTIFPYMIQENWPNLIKGELPKSGKIWESSRIGVGVKGDLKKRIIAELILAKLEYGLENGIEAYIGVMPPSLWRSVFSSNGWPVKMLGEPRKLEHYDHPVVAGKMLINSLIRNEIRKTTGVSQPILSEARWLNMDVVP